MLAIVDFRSGRFIWSLSTRVRYDLWDTFDQDLPDAEANLGPLCWHCLASRPSSNALQTWPILAVVGGIDFVVVMIVPSTVVFIAAVSEF